MSDAEDERKILFGDGSPVLELGTIRAVLKSVEECFFSVSEKFAAASEGMIELLKKGMSPETALKFRRYKMYRRRYERRGGNNYDN